MSGNFTPAENGTGAVRDELTSSFSRAYCIDAVGIERQLALETGRPFSICLVDVDHLKSVNDEHGLAAGDRVLAGLAETIRETLDLPQWQNLRCLLARFDGDSMVLVLPGCRSERAEQFGHVLRRRVADARYAGTIGVTVSVAVSAYSIGESVDELFARVERTLHLAKQFGGDCVETMRIREPRRQTASVTRLPVPFRPPAE